MAEIFLCIWIKKKKVKFEIYNSIIFYCKHFICNKRFYYSFIDSSGEQISEQRKQEITDGFDILQNAKNLARDGKIDDAFQVKDFKRKK